MGDFKISGKNVITQAGTAEPVLASNVTLGTGIITPANIQDAATSTLSCTTNSTTTVTTADTSSLSVGMAVSGTGIPAGATIVTVTNATSFTLSSAATASATNTLTFQKGIVASKIEDDAVTSAKVADDAVTAAKIATGAVVADGLGADSVTATAIATGAVVADGLGAAAVTTTALHADVTAGGAISTAIKPHIQPGILCPAVAGKLLDGSTNHSGAYGTAQADGKKYYYTDIKGSGPIKDPRIGAHFGSQRHKFKSMQLLEQETATHGSDISSFDGREWCRAIGTLTMDNNDHGQGRIRLQAAGHAFEVTGYFNGFNLLYANNNSVRNLKITIDNVVAHSSVNYNGSIDIPLGGRYVDAHAVVNVDLTSSSSLSSDTTLGIHTIKIEWVSSTSYLFGFELIAQDTTSTATKSQIQIPSQNVVSYGKKFTVSGTPHYNPFATKGDGSASTIPNNTTGDSVATGWAGSTSAYWESTLDTATSLGLTAWEEGGAFYRPVNGGRVVKWVDSTGTIKTSVNMMPPSAKAVGSHSGDATPTGATNWSTQYLPIFSTGAIDHSQAEVAKTFHWREFGNGGANQGHGNSSFNDASMLPGSGQAIAYVMDDGLTSLSADNVANDNDMLPQANDKFWHITFIGTGVTRIVKQHAQVTQTIAQNLPYGTHVLKCARQGSGGTGTVLSLDGVSITTIADGSYGELSEITFHQPKMPPIPEDAVVLADYMLMPDYVPQTAHTEGIISKGVRRTSASRDFFYNHAHASAAKEINMATHLDYSHIGPYTYIGNQAGASTQQLPFFGTSWTYRYHSLSNYMVTGGTTFTINEGNLSSYTLNAAGGGGTSITSAGVLTKIDATDKANFISAVGGTLGISVWKQSETTASGKYTYGGDLDVATPIHTSSHYQPFENQYTKDLVGGDRNMEQTNLVVSADGKTWDEATRDVSYIGKGLVFATDDENDWNTSSDYTYWRGTPPNTYNVCFNKDFTPAYDRVICLKDGQYKINYNTQNHMDGSGDSNGELRINNVIVALIRSTAHSGGNPHYSGEASVIANLKRGDYVKSHGERHMPNGYGHFEIFKI